jgi:hypothetical protein
LETRAEQVLPGGKGDGGEMAQAMYAHINKWINFLKREKKYVFWWSWGFKLRASCLVGSCYFEVCPKPFFASVIFEIRFCFMLRPTWTTILLFVLTHEVWMTGICHCTQLLVKIGSNELSASNHHPPNLGFSHHNIHKEILFKWCKIEIPTKIAKQVAPRVYYNQLRVMIKNTEKLMYVEKSSLRRDKLGHLKDIGRIYLSNYYLWGLYINNQRSYQVD